MTDNMQTKGLQHLEETTGDIKWRADCSPWPGDHPDSPGLGLGLGSQ
ncbi:hypothetical protein [Streptomyces sp. NPDC059979]